jgi:hypothetical protein
MPFTPDGQQPTTTTTPVSPVVATPSAPASAVATQGGHFVPDPTSPSMLDTAWEDYAKPGLKLAGRTIIRKALYPLDLGVEGAKLIGAGADKLGITSPQPQLVDNDGKPIGGPDTPPPTQDLINSLGIQMDPDAGLPMRAADFALPALTTGWRGKMARVAEAPGFVPKVAEIAGHVGGSLADLGLQTAGGAVGNYIGGPEGAFVGSLFGGSLRPGAQQVLGWAARRPQVFGQQREEPEPSGAPGLPSSQDVFDAMMSPEGPNTFPSFGQVTNVTGKRLEKGVGSFPIDFGVGAAQKNAEEGIQRSINTGTGMVGDRPAGAGPVDETRTAQNIIDLSREANASQQSALSAREQAIEDAIMATEAGQKTPVSPLVDLISGIANQGPGPIRRVVDPRARDLYETLSPGETDPTDVTSPWDELKILRSDLGQKTRTTDPVKGPAYDRLYGGYSDAMRGGAETAGQGPEFNQANLDYSTFKQVNQPWLERQGGGLERKDAAVNPATIAGRVEGIAGQNPNYMDEIEQQLGPGAARATVADVLSRLGQRSGKFAPDKFAQEYGGLSPRVNDFVARNAPGASPYLNNAATGARAFDLAPERPGMSKSMGWLASLVQQSMEHPALRMALSPALETPSVIRSVAGRQDIPAILAQYFARQGLMAGRQ